MKQQKKPVSISRQLSKIYLSVLLIVFFVSSAIGVPALIHLLNANLMETQQVISRTVTNSIVSYFGQMDRFSKHLIHSAVFQKAVQTEIPRAAASHTPYTDALNRVYREAYEMYEHGYEIGVLSKDDTYLWLGDQIRVTPNTLRPERYGQYDGSTIPMLYRTEGPKPSLVLARSMNPSTTAGGQQAMLEICVEERAFASYLQELIGEAGLNRLEITILNVKGEVLYGDSTVPAIPLDSWGQWTKSGDATVRMDSFLYDEAFVYYQLPNSVLLHQLMPFLGVFAMVFILLIATVFLTSLRISKGITQPIQQLSQELQAFSLTEPVRQEPLPTNLLELNDIQEILHQMQDKLTASMEEILTARTSELQSQLMALQSQMEPHFIYNTLASIASLSEQNQKQAVSDMCRNLSQMMRYVSSREANGVTLFDELTFLKNYCEIMKLRFHRAQIHIDIPMDMLLLQVPKLILQPLCENSFKYANRNDVEIWISGVMTEDQWTVTVRDNGAGFSEEAIGQILSRCSRVLQEHRVLSEKVNGLGLINIYARLALFYQNRFVFRLEPQAGITIGGALIVPKTDSNPGRG